MDPEATLRSLEAAFRAQGSVLVAFSGGVDSAVVAAVARRALGDRALAVTVDAETLARSELDHALAATRAMGLRHRVVRTTELADPAYAANPVDRCYFCRGNLVEVLRGVAEAEGIATIAAGTTVDDLSDHRPGLRALREGGVWQPLVEVGARKEDVRALARLLALPVAEKPSTACLSSRIPYGEAITLAKLSRIERGEDLLHGLGFPQVRVRSHGDVARIEVLPADIPRLAARAAEVSGALRALGFAYVALDLAGYRSGSLNEVLPAAAYHRQD